MKSENVGALATRADEGGQVPASLHGTFPGGNEIAELEVLKMREESDKIQALSGRCPGFTKSKVLKGWSKATKVLPDIWHEIG